MAVIHNLLCLTLSYLRILSRKEFCVSRKFKKNSDFYRILIYPMWGKPTLFHRAKSIEKNIEKRQILTYSIEKSSLIDPLTTYNAIYRDSFNLIWKKIFIWNNVLSIKKLKRDTHEFTVFNVSNMKWRRYRKNWLS